MVARDLWDEVDKKALFVGLKGVDNGACVNHWLYFGAKYTKAIMEYMPYTCFFNDFYSLELTDMDGRVTLKLLEKFNDWIEKFISLRTQ